MTCLCAADSEHLACVESALGISNRKRRNAARRSLRCLTYGPPADTDLTLPDEPRPIYLSGVRDQFDAADAC